MHASSTSTTSTVYSSSTTDVAPPAPATAPPPQLHGRSAESGTPLFAQFFSAGEAETSTPVHASTVPATTASAGSTTTSVIATAPRLQSHTPLLQAARNGGTATVQALLQAGAGVNQIKPNGGSALMSAAQNGHTATVQALLQAGANCWVEAKGDNALSLAIKERHAEVINLLRKHMLEPDDPLLLAVTKEDTVTVQSLLQAGTGVDKRRPNGLSILMIAVENGYTNGVQVAAQRRS